MQHIRLKYKQDKLYNFFPPIEIKVMLTKIKINVQVIERIKSNIFGYRQMNFKLYGARRWTGRKKMKKKNAWICWLIQLIEAFPPLEALLTLYLLLFEPCITCCNVARCDTFPSYLFFCVRKKNYWKKTAITGLTDQVRCDMKLSQNFHKKKPQPLSLCISGEERLQDCELQSLEGKGGGGGVTKHRHTLQCWTWPLG